MNDKDISPLFTRNGPAQLESLKQRTIAPFSPKKSVKKKKEKNIMKEKTNDYKSSNTDHSTMSKTQFSLMLEIPPPKFVEPSLLGTSLYELSLELRSLNDVFNQLRNFRYNAPLKYYSFSSLIELVNASAKCPPDTTLILLSIAKDMILLQNYAKPLYLAELIRITKIFISERYYYESYASYDPKKPERKLQKILKVLLDELNNPQADVKEGIFDTRQIEEIMSRFQNSENLTQEQVVEHYVLKYQNERNHKEEHKFKNDQQYQNEGNKKIKKKNKTEKENIEMENIEMEEERLAKERLERDRLEVERLEKERLEKEKLENERLENLKRKELEKLRKERLEQKIMERGKIEEEIMLKDKAKKEQIDKERLEKEKIEKEKRKKERLEKRKEIEESLGKARLEKERLLNEKLEKIMNSKEKNDKERTDKDKLGKSNSNDVNYKSSEKKNDSNEKTKKHNQNMSGKNKTNRASKDQALSSPNNDHMSPKPKILEKPIHGLNNRPTNQSEFCFNASNDEPILSLFPNRNPNITPKKPERNLEITDHTQKNKTKTNTGKHELDEYQFLQTEQNYNNRNKGRDMNLANAYNDYVYTNDTYQKNDNKNYDKEMKNTSANDDDNIDSNQTNDNKNDRKIPKININKISISPKKEIIIEKKQNIILDNDDSDVSSENITTFLESKDTIHQRKEKGAKTYWKLTPSQIRRICELAKLFNKWETAYPASQIVWNEMKNDQFFDINALLSIIETAYGDFLIEALKTFAKIDGISIQKIVHPR